jgi:hypothetical protein
LRISDLASAGGRLEELVDRCGPVVVVVVEGVRPP